METELLIRMGLMGLMGGLLAVGGIGITEKPLLFISIMAIAITYGKVVAGG